MKKEIVFSTVVLFLLIAFIGCQNSGNTVAREKEQIDDSSRRDSVFTQLMTLTSNLISADQQEDSLAFMIVPLQNSCITCLSKTIDSIIKYKNSFPANRFVILSLKGGRKFAGSFFKKENAELPVLTGKIFIDSTDLASHFKLYENNPALYFSSRKQAVSRILIDPRTVKEDLHLFFSKK